MGLCLLLSLDVWAVTPVDSLAMLITGGLRGRLEGCACPSAKRGGLARRATLMRQLYGNRVPLGVDCGQLLDLDPEGGKMRSVCAILSLGRMGTEVSLVSKRDLYYGVDFIKHVADSADISLVCANIVDSISEELIFTRWVELEHEDVKIAFTGLTQHFPHRRIPGMDSWVTVPTDSAIVQIKKTVPQSADLVILLTDMSESELSKLIPSFPTLDIVLTSSRRVYSPSPIAVNSTLIIRPQPDGSSLEGVMLPIDVVRIASCRVFIYPINASISSDDEFEKWLKKCKKSYLPLK